MFLGGRRGADHRPRFVDERAESAATRPKNVRRQALSRGEEELRISPRRASVGEGEGAGSRRESLESRRGSLGARPPVALESPVEGAEDEEDEEDRDIDMDVTRQAPVFSDDELDPMDQS